MAETEQKKTIVQREKGAAVVGGAPTSAVDRHVVVTDAATINEVMTGVETTVVAKDASKGRPKSISIS